MFYSVVCGVQVESKTTAGGWRAAPEKPQFFPIPKETLMGGLINLYEIIDEHLSWRLSIEADSDRFFLGVNQGTTVHGTNKSTFLLDRTWAREVSRKS